MGYLAIAAAALCWALLGPVSRVPLAQGITPMEIAFWRATIAGAVFAAHAAAQRGPRLARRDLLPVAGFGVVGITLLYAAYFAAVRAGGAALAAVLLYTAPAWVALLAWGFLRERPTRLTLIALVITLVGVTGIAAASGGVRPSGAAIGWGLASGLSYSLYYVFGKRYFARYEASTVFALALPVGALGLLPLTRFHHKTPTAWGALAVIALVSTYLAYLCYAAGLRRLPATRAALVATLEPVAAAVLAYVFWQERLAPLGYAAAVLVVIGALLPAAQANG